MKTLAIGIDFGGTNTKVGVVEKGGEILTSKEFPTLPERGPEDFIKRLSEIIATFKRSYGKEIIGIGAGIPSWDGEKKQIINPPNLPGFHQFSFCQRLEEVFPEWKGKILADNDANVSALAELLYGGWPEAKRGIIVLTLGSGIGFGGYIFDPKTSSLVKITGARYRGGEGGHIAIPLPPGAIKRKCGCGCEYCLEAYASATAISDFAKIAIKKMCAGEGETEIVKVIQESPEYDPSKPLLCQVNPRHVEEAARLGDREARQILFWSSFALAYGIRSFIQLFDPGIVVLTGGVSRWKELVEKTKSILKTLPGVVPVADTKVEVSRLKNPGILGAASLIFEKY